MEVRRELLEEDEEDGNCIIDGGECCSVIGELEAEKIDDAEIVIL
jgi:hypothetical protein